MKMHIIFFKNESIFASVLLDDHTVCLLGIPSLQFWDYSIYALVRVNETVIARLVQ